MIAHALEVVGDLHRGRQEAEVAGHRLLGREEPDHRFFDVELELIDGLVAQNDLTGLGAVPLQHGLDGRAQRCLGVARHVEQRDLELRQLVVEMAMARRLRVHPNLPVM